MLGKQKKAFMIGDNRRNLKKEKKMNCSEREMF